jgi:hypothetical protein
MSRSTHLSGLTIAPNDVTAATYTATQNVSGKVITLNAAAGVTVTLPAATGSGTKLAFFVGTTVTSNADIIQVASAADTMSGYAILGQDAADTTVLFETAATSDTITMNGSTTGGVLGAQVELTDVATGKWMVNVYSAATGTEATPFSAAV